MVKSITVKIWKCPYCSAQFKNSDECDDHLENHLEFPIELDEGFYACEICQDEFKDYSKAYSCEQSHRDGNDVKYQAFLDLEEKKKLLRASEHPSQKKLIEDKNAD